MKRNRHFAEFFAGIGLVRKGLESSGWTCVFANDIDAKKFDTYRANFDHDHFLLKDIWEVSNSEIPHKCDLFTASFPCVDLSLAGNRKGLAGKESGTLLAFLEILRVRKKANNLPSVILLENVLGFLSSHDGKDFISTAKELSDLGYFVDAFTLDARWFTAQSRPRLFVVASIATNSKDIFVSPSSLFEHRRIVDLGTEELRPKKLLQHIYNSPSIRWGQIPLTPPVKSKQRLHDIVEQMEFDDPRWWEQEKVDYLIKQMSPLHLALIKQALTSKSDLTGTVYRRVREGKTRAELRTDGIAGCLRTPRGGSSKQILLTVAKKKVHARWMTPREYARLQGVDDSYNLPDNEIQAYFGLGDAVCVPAIEWIARNVLAKIFASTTDKTKQDKPEFLQQIAASA